LLTREQFDAIEFEAAMTGDHQAAAEQMSELAATGTQTESMARAEAFVRAGEQWLLADNADLAVQDFRLAIADGGPVDVDPRVPLSRALFQLDRGDDAYALISELRAEGRTDPRACDMITELLVEQSDLPGALDWATAGVKLLVGGEDAAGQAGSGTSGANGPALAGLSADESSSSLRDLLRLRFRIRNDLRLPEDEYDRMLGS
jgi:hypothetical protein